MPKIQPFITTSTGGANRLNARASTASLGSGFRAAGQALSQVAGAIEGEAERRNQEEVSSKIAKLQTDSFLDVERLKQEQVNPDGEGFAKSAEADFTARKEAMSEEFSSAAAQRAFNAQAEQIGVSVFKHSFKHEANLRSDFAFKQTQESMQNETNVIRANPEMLEETLAARKKAIEDNSRYSPEVKASLLQKLPNAYHDSALDGQVTSFISRNDATPSEVDDMLKLVNSEKWQNGASKGMFDSVLTRLQNHKKRLNTQDAEDFKRTFSERMLHQRITGEESAFTKKDILSKGFSKSQTNAMLEVLDYSKKVGDINKNMPQLSEKELIAKMSEKNFLEMLKKNPDKTNELVAERKALINAASGRSRALKDDAAKYSAEHNPDIADKLESLTEITSSNASPEEKNKTAQEYIKATSAYQKTVNPNEEPSLIPKSRAAYFADQVNKALDSEQGAEKAYRLLANEKQLWGDSWYLAKRDYKKHKALNDTQFMAAGVMDSPSLAREILNSQATPVKDIRDKLSRDVSWGIGSKYPEVVSEVENQLEDFFDSTANSMSAQGHQEVKRMYTDVIAKTAALRIIRGDDSWDGKVGTSEAIKSLVKEFVSDKYTFSAGVRIPKDKYNFNVEQGFDGYKQDIIDNPDKIVPPTIRGGVSKTSAKARYLSNIQSSSRWVNDHDKGARLVDSMGGQVYIINEEGQEEAVIRTWEEIEARGNATSGKNISPVRGF